MTTQLERTKEFLELIQSYSPAELRTLSQITQVLIEKQKREAAPPERNKPFELSALNVPAEYLVNYHVFLFQAFCEELFSNYDGYYEISQQDELTNNSSVFVTSAWSTATKVGQAPHIIVEAESAVLSPVYLADRNDFGSARIMDKTFSYSSCMMNIGMNIQIIAGAPAEATNIANIILMALARTRPIIRDIFALNSVSFPAMSPAAAMDGSPEQRFLSSVRFGTEKFVHWSESVTEKTYKNLIYRLVAKCSQQDSEPLVQMLWRSGWSLDPNIEKFINSVKRRPL